MLEILFGDLKNWLIHVIRSVALSSVVTIQSMVKSQQHRL